MTAQPPKWHSAEYSARQIAGLRDRLARCDVGHERPAITWLLEVILAGPAPSGSCVPS